MEKKRLFNPQHFPGSNECLGFRCRGATFLKKDPPGLFEHCLRELLLCEAQGLFPTQAKFWARKLPNGQQHFRFRGKVGEGAMVGSLS